MDAATALARLELFTQSDVEPTLSEAELDVLLTLAQVPDADGYEPQDDDWTPTYSATFLNLSIAEGWEVKAAKLGAGETFSADGASFNPETRRQFCLDKAAVYRKKVGASAIVSGRASRIESWDLVGSLAVNG